MESREPDSATPSDTRLQLPAPAALYLHRPRGSYAHRGRSAARARRAVRAGTPRRHVPLEGGCTAPFMFRSFAPLIHDIRQGGGKVPKPSTLAADLSYAAENSAFSDVAFTLDGEAHPAHKVLLAARSEYASEVLYYLARLTSPALAISAPCSCSPSRRARRRRSALPRIRRPLAESRVVSDRCAAQFHWRRLARLRLVPLHRRPGDHRRHRRRALRGSPSSSVSFLCLLQACLTPPSSAGPSVLET